MQNTLNKKLFEIRRALNYMQKTEKGQAANSAYVDSAVLLQKLRDAMDQHGVIITLELEGAKTERVPAPTSKNKDNVGYFVTSNIIYTFASTDSNEKLSCVWYATGFNFNDPAMALGSALTYAERYFLLKFFQIPTAKDDPDYFENKVNGPEKLTDQQVADINGLIDELKIDIRAFCAHMKVKRIEDIYTENYPYAISALESKRGS